MLLDPKLNLQWNNKKNQVTVLTFHTFKVYNEKLNYSLMIFNIVNELFP